MPLKAFVPPDQREALVLIMKDPSDKLELGAEILIFKVENLRCGLTALVGIEGDSLPSLGCCFVKSWDDDDVTVPRTTLCSGTLPHTLGRKLV